MLCCFFLLLTRRNALFKQGTFFRLRHILFIDKFDVFQHYFFLKGSILSKSLLIGSKQPALKVNFLSNVSIHKLNIHFHSAYSTVSKIDISFCRTNLDPFIRSRAQAHSVARNQTGFCVVVFLHIYVVSMQQYFYLFKKIP